MLSSIVAVLLTIHGALGAKSIFIESGTDQFVPNTLVLAIDHKSQEAELHVSPEIILDLRPS